MTLQHVSLEVRRPDTPGELRFWTLLGFTEVEPAGTLAEVASWLQRGPNQIHLLWDDDPVVPPSGHAAVVVDDFDATLAALRELGWNPDPAGALDNLIESEDEVTEALHAVIPHSGQEAASEALEHLMEHIIMRKQNQIDWLRRARRQP